MNILSFPVNYGSNIVHDAEPNDSRITYEGPGGYFLTKSAESVWWWEFSGLSNVRHWSLSRNWGKVEDPT